MGKWSAVALSISSTDVLGFGQGINFGLICFDRILCEDVNSQCTRQMLERTPRR
jgi:hypothetical protein